MRNKFILEQKIKIIIKIQKDIKHHMNIFIFVAIFLLYFCYTYIYTYIHKHIRETFFSRAFCSHRRGMGLYTSLVDVMQWFRISSSSRIFLWWSRAQHRPQKQQKWRKTKKNKKFKIFKNSKKCKNM